MAEIPVLKPEDFTYREAFFTLNNSRTAGMGGANPLAISEILSLVSMGGIAYIGDRVKYLRLIQQMDRTFLEFHAEKTTK